ncbi:hypothetical protein HaLaN_18174 [Haematococcus lacustris]|uniref:Uncharacterized protein n=1 Tax=Haematococcus lacustris TaxID=44745 RepID=A0A699ZEA8_HAELA|nr:hypothetical protein HaLaN_18174 [Haematococcus lacustris]
MVQVLTEAQELQEVPLYFVEGVGVREVDPLHLDQVAHLVNGLTYN